MNVVLSSLWLTCLIAATPAFAESDGDAMKAFGLVGTWSPDCAADMDKRTYLRITFNVPFLGSPTQSISTRMGSLVVTTTETAIKKAERATEDKLKITFVVTKAGNLNASGPPLDPQGVIEQVVAKQGKKLILSSATGTGAEQTFEKCLN